MGKKAIVLLSGGLDSILAVRLMQEQGVEVLAMTFYIEFAACGGSGKDGGPAKKAAGMLGVSLETIDITKEYLEMFTKPKHGYGANINPCIDCKIFMLKKAKERMGQVGASFLVTGEVLGERPMSQRKDALNIIERDAGVRGILLRPLSAKLLEPTKPELEGFVDREKLLDISGRSRKPQMELAAKFGIKEYPNAAGGCLLTDPGFSRRMKDLIKHNALNMDNIRLLRLGRHFRLSDDVKLIVGRDDRENSELERLVQEGDISLRLKDYPGPFSILKGTADQALIDLAARIAAYHTKFRDRDELLVEYKRGDSTDCVTITVKPAALDEIEPIRIG